MHWKYKRDRFLCFIIFMIVGACLKFYYIDEQTSLNVIGKVVHQLSTERSKEVQIAGNGSIYVDGVPQPTKDIYFLVSRAWFNYQRGVYIESNSTEVYNQTGITFTSYLPYGTEPYVWFLNNTHKPGLTKDCFIGLCTMPVVKNIYGLFYNQPGNMLVNRERNGQDELGVMYVRINTEGY